MRAGKLRHYITIQQPSETQSPEGANIITWTTFAQVWADITTPTGREWYSSDAHNADISHVVNLRYLSGITRKMQVLYDGRVYQIENVLQKDERKFEMTLLCREFQ